MTPTSLMPRQKGAFLNVVLAVGGRFDLASASAEKFDLWLTAAVMLVLSSKSSSLPDSNMHSLAQLKCLRCCHGASASLWLKTTS